MGNGERKPRLLIIDPAMTTAEEQGAAEIARDWPGESRLVRPALCPGEGPAPGDGYEADAIVLMGSRASVHESHAWMRDLACWLAPILDGSVRRPLLGICFGHQLIAHLTGARVSWVHDDHHKECGYTQTTLDGGRLLPGRHGLRVVASHFESVHDVPVGYRVTASRPQVPIDALEHERLPIFSVQFHPEGREHFACKCNLDPGGIDARLREESGRILAAYRARALEAIVQSIGWTEAKT